MKTALFIPFLCFQMAFGETLARVPAQTKVDVKKLTAEVEGFKSELVGRDDRSHCEEIQPAPVSEEASEEIDFFSADSSAEEDFFSSFMGGGANVITSSEESKFQSLVRGMGQNACGVYTYSFDEKEKASEAASECQPKHVPGLIDIIVAETMEAESEGKEPKVFNAKDVRVLAKFNQAKELKARVEIALEDESLVASERHSLLVTYLNSILLPMRDLVVSKRAYIKGESDYSYLYKDLLVSFPSEIAPEDDVHARELITIGPNPSEGQHYLKIESKGWSDLQVVFDEQEVLIRDIGTLVKAPTAENYIRALKWMTLQMMTSQIFVYETIVGKAGSDYSLKIPNSCQSHFNGSLPSEFKFNFREGEKDKFIDNILINHGLIVDRNNYAAVEYYLENVDKDPTKSGYSGLVPFEEYRNAKVAVESPGRAKIDDIAHFDQVFQSVVDEARALYHSKTARRRISRGTWSPGKDITYLDQEIFEKIVATPGELDQYEITLKDGTKELIDPMKQNLSVYLAERMQSLGALHFEEIISDELKAKLEKTELHIDFPGLYGSSIWRNWGLRVLGDYIHSLQGTNDVYVMQVINMTCTNFGGHGEIGKVCASRMNGHKGKVAPHIQTLANLDERLKEFREVSDFIPTRRIQESKIEEIYPLLRALWIKFSALKGQLTEAKPSEYEFLMNQMRALNPWARLRLSYLIAREQMSSMRSGHGPTYRSNGLWKSYDSNTRCFFNNIDASLDRLDGAAKVLGLNRPLSPFIASRVASRGVRDGVWKRVYEDVNEGTGQLFTVKDQEGKEFYRHLEDTSVETLVSHGRVENFLKNLGISVDDEALDKIEEIKSSEQGELAEFLSKLYSMKGDVKAQSEFFADFANDHGIDNNVVSKLVFLDMDNRYKKPIMESLLRSAASERLAQLKAQLGEFCNLEPNDHEKFQTLFYATSKAQNMLNSMAGLQSVPEEVMDKVNSMSPSEKVDMVLGIGAGILGITAIGAASLCTVVSGGLCAPLGVYMIGAGMAAISAQSALVYREFNRKKNANEYSSQVKKMEDLGFANFGSSDAVSRGWFWTAFETISIFPLIGISARAFKLGSKMAIIAGKRISGKMGEQGFKAASRQAIQEEDVRYAKNVLGFGSKGVNQSPVDELTAQLKAAGVKDSVVTKTIDSYKKAITLHKQGAISTRELIREVGRLMNPFSRMLEKGGAKMSELAVGSFGKVVVDESLETINARTIKVVTNYFGGNPKGLQKLLRTYSGKRLDLAIKRMEETLPKLGPVRSKLTGWFYKMRAEHLYTQRDNLRALEKALAQTISKKSSFEDFVSANLEELSDFFLKVPMRKRELPYLVFVQGGPFMGGTAMFRKAPIIGQALGDVFGNLSDGLILKKIFTARSRLLTETLKSEARATLGIAVNVAAESAYDTYQSFHKAVMKQVSERADVGESSIDLLTSLRELEEDLTRKITDHVSALRPDGKFKFKEAPQFVNLDQESIARVLFAPRDISEEALGSVLWQSVPTEELFKLGKFEETAHKALTELSQYSGMNQFEDFLTALKVLIIKRNPAVVEYY